ncbi:RNA polymerase sigma factor (sigma-70 family) [Microbacterium trichothecenolyticum]|uniref:RNA polymerase sigma factor n=1 Tax=Microbacterium trichothecenolyticum TaxID=69370 RepID=UPI0028638F7A|nr:sigma-70 family RNA polymerase sigma factor [Microbacterium trichothecenolyticum]MDR7185183.1 RNA polymerase sigma factor (sigma-70 family) [Microbacterium trichothecenolyticum]
MDHEEVQEHETEVVADADADLVLRTRSGDTDAFAELWRRHYRAGVTVARNMTSSLDADDLVQEAYTRIYHSIVQGGGPTGSFRAYLFTSIRNTAAAWGRARRETAYEELDGVEDPSGAEHESEAALDRGLTHQAFRSLPTRWQEVLWYSEIERMKPAEIAPLLGMKPTAVAQLTFRAREGLREAWIQAHLRSVADGSDCQWTIERLGAYSRLNLGRRDHAKLEQHLGRCVRCSIVASEAKEVSSRLALVLLPIALGAVGTAGYLATVQGSGTSLVALASMPTSVVHTTATIAPGGVVGAGATASAGAGAATSAGVGSAGAVGAAGAATAVASTGAVFGTSAVAGIGAASGLAAAGLVVVSGVVAAAVMLPATAGPEPAPTPTPTNEVSAENVNAPGLLPEETGDTALQLPAEPGPGPADVPIVSDASGDGDGDAQGGGAASSGGGKATGQTGNGSAKGDEDAQGNNGNPTSNNGNGNTGNNGDGNTSNNGNANGNGNGNGNSAGNGESGNNGNGNGNTGNSGNGTPTNGTGSGNGGTTGNGGSTGNGTPTNGTGNGNGGNTGAGSGTTKRNVSLPNGLGRGVVDRMASATASDVPADAPEAADTLPLETVPADGGN